MLRSAKVIVFLGPPGSGKGTQADRLSSALSIPAISTGEMLRRECRSGSAIGRAVQQIIASGQLVSDDLINRAVANRLRQQDCEGGCILDGYPRTVPQARYLEKFLRMLNVPAPVVFDFEIPSEEIVSRLSRRRQCDECGRIFTLAATDASLLCDRDGSRLVQRADDDPDTIRQRLRIYRKNAAKLIRYYQTRDYHPICATRTPAQICDDLLNVLALETSAAVLPGTNVAVPTGYADLAFS